MKNSKFTYTETELREMISKMKAVSAAFYSAAVGTGVHAFIEMTGLMNEFIRVCEQSLAAEVDFATSNTHSGRPLVVHTFNAAYIVEKLDCIFGPSIKSSPEVRAAFAKLVEVEKEEDNNSLDGGWASFHDVVVEATPNKSKLPARSPCFTRAYLEAVFDALPEHIKATARQHGLSDTPFRDAAYEFLLAHPAALAVKDTAMHFVTKATFRKKEPLPPLCGDMGAKNVTVDPDKVTCLTCKVKLPMPKCAYCKKEKANHKAVTFNCPVGRKSRIGLTSYDALRTFTSKEDAIKAYRFDMDVELLGTLRWSLRESVERQKTLIALSRLTASKTMLSGFNRTLKNLEKESAALEAFAAKIVSGQLKRGEG